MASDPSNDLKLLNDEYMKLYPDEVAGFLEKRPANEIAVLFKDQKMERITPVFEKLTPSLAAIVIEKADSDTAKKTIAGLEPSRAAALLARLSKKERDRVLKLLDTATATELVELMMYPPNSAGSLMDPAVMTFKPETSVSQARVRLRKFRQKRIQELFLVDQDSRLIGSVPLLELTIAPAQDKLAQLKRPVVASVPAIGGREEVVEIFSRQRLASLPVVDVEGRILGVIRYDTLVEAAQSESSADIQTMVGVSKEERALSKVSFSVRKRLPWLEVNLGTAFLAAAVVGIFEDTIARFTALAILLPVVAGQSGNTGAQALAVTMRGLTLREIRVRQAVRVLFKELRVGFINGVVVALTTSLFVFLWSRSFGLSLVIGVSMVVSMTIAGFAGAAVPLVLTVLRQDPAQSSSIILTTVTDVCGFLSFLGIATLLSGLL